MLKVTGQATLKVRYEVELPISEAAYEAMSEQEAHAYLDGHIDWQQACQNAETNEIDVWDYEEVDNIN
ncbi:hypothetical protein [Lysinibacillus piscis]|uniref:Uncharacterized protein n=1 Tax=Lysinibacillus piscis TaxID=2518931 RepID=A0ABQ5NJW6_9BACI|nr:hypothetical protein [Lysinibacillus sp. KH24]GLC88662.1 hypothetical protein LYSBPC_17890 [Lysinibacillus sp. KH24]